MRSATQHRPKPRYKARRVNDGGEAIEPQHGEARACVGMFDRRGNEASAEIQPTPVLDDTKPTPTGLLCAFQPAGTT